MRAERLLLRDVEVGSRRVDVRVRAGLVTEVGSDLASADETLVEGGGGALLPGLHDHHLHLLAMAAHRGSVDCGEGLEALARAPGDGWVRGVGAVDSVDRQVLDSLEPHRPVRVQHRSGALWMLNSAALRVVSHVLDGSADVERDAAGEPTGRLWRYDARLRPALPVPDLAAGLAAVADDLRRLGVTSVTDATPDLDPAGVELLRAFPLAVTLLGDPDGRAPWKIHLRDHDLPSYDDVRAVVARARESGRPVAVHCVTRESLLLTLAVLDDLGRVAGDRIEHASVVPDPRSLRGLFVVTQPGFVAVRGEHYRREVRADDLPHLYRFRSLLQCGVDVVASSDAPYGPLDPWQVVRAARERRTEAGRTLGRDETVTARQALSGYLRDAQGRPRRVTPGATTPLVLLDSPLEDMFAGRGSVRASWSPG